MRTTHHAQTVWFMNLPLLIVMCLAAIAPGVLSWQRQHHLQDSRTSCRTCAEPMRHSLDHALSDGKTHSLARRACIARVKDKRKAH